MTIKINGVEWVLVPRVASDAMCAAINWWSALNRMAGNAPRPAREAATLLVDDIRKNRASENDNG